MKRFLIIDDDQALGRSLELQLQAQEYEAVAVVTGKAGLAALDESEFDAVFLDLTLPDRTGLSILQEIQKSRPELPVIVISGRQDMESTISAIKFGAFDYIRKPLDMDVVLLVIEKLKCQLKLRLCNKEHLTAETFQPVSSRELVGNDPKILEILKQIGLLSRNRIAVLIQGESGTGKELIARALHSASVPDQPFVAINCSAVVETLLESELFGHEKGAFTGADRRKTGKLEEAADGTVFFDEIGDMNMDLQAKLLRVLQEYEFERVGGTQLIPFRARPVFATHRDLSKMVTDGTFRQDLYYRIAVACISIPSLRERRQDISVLTNYLLKKIGRSQKTQISGIESTAMDILKNYEWPGNVRELENVLTRAVAMSYSPVITADLISIESTDQTCEAILGLDTIRPLADIEKDHIACSLTATGWNITQTAKLLRISPTTLRKKIADYKLIQ